MKKQRIILCLFALLVWGPLSGCALLSKSAPITPRYFTPELSRGAGEAASAPKTDQKLRIGNIKAGPHLRERMAYRTSEQEVAYYNERRWTERPEAYLRRALSRALFEEYGFVRAISGASPTLDAELVAFEEIQTGEHAVRVEVVINLYDMAGGHMQRTVVSQKTVEGKKDEPEAVVRALAEALHAVISEIAETISKQLAESATAAETKPEERSRAKRRDRRSRTGAELLRRGASNVPSIRSVAADVRIARVGGALTALEQGFQTEQIDRPLGAAVVHELDDFGPPLVLEKDDGVVSGLLQVETDFRTDPLGWAIRHLPEHARCRVSVEDLHREPADFRALSAEAELDGSPLFTLALGILCPPRCESFARREGPIDLLCGGFDPNSVENVGHVECQSFVAKSVLLSRGDGCVDHARNLALAIGGGE
jgi:cholesterol transport system auxiliary component